MTFYLDFIYTLSNDQTEEISRKMTMQEVNKTFRNIRKNSQQKSESTQKSEDSQKRQEKVEKSERGELVRFALEDTKERQDFAIEQNIKEVSKMNSVAQLSGEEFKKGETDLVTQVTDFFNSLQNHADNAELGEITLDRRGVKDDIAHGIGRKKAASFAAIPKVVRHGKVVDFQKNWKNRGYDTAVIAAPIEINGIPHFMGIVLISENNSNRFYVHEVLSTEEGALSFKTGTAKNNGTPGDNAPSVISILQKIANVKRKSLSTSNLDAFAVKNVPDYRKLSAPNQSAVRMTIRQAMAHGLSEADVVLYARVAARSGLNVVFDAEQAGSDGILRENTIYVNPSLSEERTYRTVAGHEMEHVLFRGKKGKQLIADALRHIDPEKAQKVSERYISFYKKKELSMEEYLPIVNEEIATAYGEQILGKEGAWEYVLSEDPTLKDKVLGFFGKAARDYSFHEGMSREERRFLRMYRKLFNELSERNMGNNALALIDHTNSEDTRFAFVGRTDDGRGVYRSNYPKNTPKSVKQKDIIDLVQNVWSKKPIKLNLIVDGKTVPIEARFNPDLTERSDLSKIVFGNRKGTNSEKRITLDLSSDLYQIAEESHHVRSKTETGKENPAHLGVSKWHYFLTNLVFVEEDGTKVDCYMNIDVKQSDNGHWFYSFAIEKGTAPRTLLAGVTDESATVPDISITENEEKSNTFAENSSNKILDERNAFTDEELAQMEPPAEDKQSSRLTREALLKNIEKRVAKPRPQ